MDRVIGNVNLGKVKVNSSLFIEEELCPCLLTQANFPPRQVLVTMKSEELGYFSLFSTPVPCSSLISVLELHSINVINVINVIRILLLHQT
jgi:hypothetical protein